MGNVGEGGDDGDWQGWLFKDRLLEVGFMDEARKVGAKTLGFRR